MAKAWRSATTIANRRGARINHASAFFMKDKTGTDANASWQPFAVNRSIPSPLRPISTNVLDRPAGVHQRDWGRAGGREPLLHGLLRRPGSGQRVAGSHGPGHRRFYAAARQADRRGAGAAGPRLRQLPPGRRHRPQRCAGRRRHHSARPPRRRSGRGAEPGQTPLETRRQIDRRHARAGPGGPAAARKHLDLWN